MTRKRFEQLRKLYDDRGYIVINECLDEIARLREAIQDAPSQNNCGCNMPGIKEFEEWHRRALGGGE